MKKIVLICGLIAGTIVTVLMVFSAAKFYADQNYDLGMTYGYASMILAFSLIFVGIKNFRDKYNEGIISFGQAFRIGLYITLIGSTFYVITWLIEYYFFFPDFMDKYAAHMIIKSQSAGISQVALAKQLKEVNTMKELYKQPVMVILFTYLEILPVGLLVTLIGALILKRKPGSKQASKNQLT